jgi:predicted DNA-binding transcriptional regulator AlpA
MSDTLPLPPAATGPTEPRARKRRRRLSPLVVDARRLARLLCCGLRTVRTWDAGGRLPAPIRIGGRVVWRVAEIRAWLAAGAPDRQTWAAIRAARR